MKFKLSKMPEDDPHWSWPTDNTTIEYTFEATHLPVILEEIQAFLKGCGFYFQGKLEDVPSEYEEDEVDD